MPTDTFQGKVAIITGASSGIGKALALGLAAEGARLALAARDAQRLDTVAADCRTRGGQAVAIPTDVTDEVQCQRLIHHTYDTYGWIDLLVNNAGIAVFGQLEDLPDLRLFRQVMEVNFYGTVYCSYHALPFIKQARGRIVNVSSLGGLVAIPFNTSYIASKSAVNGFSDSLRMELSETGVSVTVVCPYWVITEFHERYLDKDGQPKGSSGRAIYTNQMMTADRCGRIILEAARRRKRQVLLGPGPVAAWLKLIAPSWLDRLVSGVFLRPALERLSSD